MSGDKLSDAEFLSIKQQIEMLCGLCRRMDLGQVQQVVERLAHWETMMPYLDPTSYIKYAGNLDEHLRLHRAFLAFRRELQRLAPGDIEQGSEDETNVHPSEVPSDRV